ncbi:MAG: P-loop NTPase fold protein [Spirochaetia bacterium]
MAKSSSFQNVDPIIIDDKAMPHEEVIAKIKSFIHHKGHMGRKIILLDGKEGSGKSSVLKTLKEKELHQGYFFIQLDAWLTAGQQGVPVIFSTIVHSLLEEERKDLQVKSWREFWPLIFKKNAWQDLKKITKQWLHQQHLQRKLHRLLKQITQQRIKTDFGPDIAYSLLLYGSLFIMWNYARTLADLSFAVWQLAVLGMLAIGSFFSVRIREIVMPSLAKNYIQYEDPLENGYLSHHRLERVCEELLAVPEKKMIIFVENIDRLRATEQQSYLDALYMIIESFDRVHSRTGEGLHIWWLLSLDMQHLKDHAISEGLFDKLSPYRVYLPGMTRRLAEKLLLKYLGVLEKKNPLLQYPDTKDMMEIFSDVWASLDPDMPQVIQLYEPRSIKKYFNQMQVFSQTTLQELPTYTVEHDRAMKIICATAAMQGEQKILKKLLDDNSYFSRQSDGVRTYLEIWLKNLSFPTIASLSDAWLAGDSAYILQYCGGTFSQMFYNTLRECFAACLKSSKKNQMPAFLNTSCAINYYYYQYYQRPIIAATQQEVISSKMRIKDWPQLGDNTLGHLYALSPQMAEISREITRRTQESAWKVPRLHSLCQWFMLDPHLDYTHIATATMQFLRPLEDDFAHNYEQVFGKKQGTVLEKIFWNYARIDFLKNYTQMGTDIYRGNIALRGLSCVFNNQRAQDVGLSLRTQKSK